MNCSSATCPYGFRIVGTCQNERRLVDWPSAFQAYSQCDERAEVVREAYLSAFRFGLEFKEHLSTRGTTKGFAGECYAEWLWFDIDREGDIDSATNDARKIAGALAYSYDIDEDAILCFFSGSKGYHIGLPLSACGSPKPSVTFNKVCRTFADSVASQAGVAIDTSIYDRVRAFRAPSSRHPKTGLFKRCLSVAALLRLQTSRIITLAESPEPFEIPLPLKPISAAVCEWEKAFLTVNHQLQASVVRREVRAPSLLNQLTLDFIRNGAAEGDRHRILFSAAANLAEFDCSLELALALLSEPALDSGLPPSEVRRQIQCGLDYAGAMQ